MRATHFVLICWILAERIPTADSALQIETDILLAWWFQGRLDTGGAIKTGTFDRYHAKRYR